ncbi:hypothetical protein AB0N59_02095 [Microbacterium sp. NPDC089321]|uniref:hypothetical protein n=1 Tax=Microbacterium sp. NPDC089321 TaxID=3155183 RepID=UPI00343FE19D
MGTHRRALATALAGLLALTLAGCARSGELVDTYRDQESIATQGADGSSPESPKAPTAEELARAHEGEAEFVGTVTGYEAPEGVYSFCVDEESCVAVDGAGVSLALIDTWGISCYSDEGVDEQLAISAKEEALPIGTRVKVIRDREPGDNAYNMSGFIHRLDATNAPVKTSINEALVATGYWVPDYYWSNSQQVGNFRPGTNWVTGADASRGDTIFASSKPSLLTPVQAPYAQLILDAANGARMKRTGGQDVCVAQIEQMVAEDNEGRARYQETSARLELEYEKWKRDNPGWDRCIDGDGDGVCHER